MVKDLLTCPHDVNIFMTMMYSLSQNREKLKFHCPEEIENR